MNESNNKEIKETKEKINEEKQPDRMIDHEDFVDEDSISQIGIPDIDIKKQMGCGG